MFKEYLHVERFGNQEVEGIELGEVYIFPKVDGTNASVYTHKHEDNTYSMRGGSRTRELSLEKDNAGFFSWVLKDNALFHFTRKYPNLRLYGEWLVPHTFKGYREEAWRKFYVFDVYNDETEQYLSYPVYSKMLEEAGITYIPPLAVVKNGNYETFLKYVVNNFFLCPDGGSPGEGICLKNYDFINKDGKQAVAKIIRGLMNEERILDAIQLSHIINKTYAKITNDKLGWSSKYIPELFNRVFYDVVKEELWDSLKEIKFGTVNFQTMKALVIQRVKKQLPEVF